MSQINDLLVIAALLLIPLIPAAVLYKALTPRRGAGTTGSSEPEEGRARGTFSTDGLWFGKANLTFNVVGSTATYVVLLAVAVLTYMHLLGLADKQADRIAQSMKDNQAWIVRVPVNLQDPAGDVLPTDGQEIPQVRVEVQPALTSASANTITFRVLTTDGKFPTARFNLPDIGLNPVVLDLNDANKVRLDYTSHMITGIEPVWIVVAKAYGARKGNGLITSRAAVGDGARPALSTTAPASAE